jgi:hypothetical protein
MTRQGFAGSPIDQIGSQTQEPVMTGKSFFARISYSMLVTACAGSPLAATHAVAAKVQPFLPEYRVSSTVPPNGDLNPYGIAFVPSGFPKGGKISPGDVLVSNFNDMNNCQGQGTTVIQYTPSNSDDSVASPNTATQFFASPQLGLSTALGVLKGGFVIVGNVPSGMEQMGVCSPTPSQGTLQVIDRHGKVVNTLTDSVGGFYDSPWDLTIANDNGTTAQLFVANVLTGKVARLDLAVGGSNVTIQHQYIIAQGYTHGLSSAAFVLGPTGLALDQSGNLFVASTADNVIYRVSNASKQVPPAPVNKGTVAFSDPHLHGPLALVFSPTGTLLTANGDAVDDDPAHPSEIVEFTTAGEFIRELNIEATEGGAFGLAINTNTDGSTIFNFAAVDDITNSVIIRAPQTGKRND